MPYDERALEELIEESQDLQSDAMTVTRTGLADMVEIGQDRRAAGGYDPDEQRQFADERRTEMRDRLVGLGALGAGAFGVALLGLFDSPAFADQSMDVQILQTAASLETLAVATYGVALTLPFIGGAQANPVVKKFAQTTMDQHDQHHKAFNAATTQLGGKEQNNPDPALVPVVDQAKPTLTGPTQVVDLAMKLELTATQTYVANLQALGDQHAKEVMASIVGVESQHFATLAAVGALLKGGAPQLIALPPDAAKLPAAAGSVGFPDTFIKSDNARPAAEGAVK